MKRSLLLLTALFCYFQQQAQSINVSAASTIYTQNFDSLAKNGANNTAIPYGWYFHEIGNTQYADGKYGTDLFTGIDPNIYSLGDDVGNAPPYLTNPDPNDRSLGLQVHTVFFPSPRIGAKVVNQDATLAITGLALSYKGETWNQYSTTQVDTLKFYYSVDADSFKDPNATWTPYPAFDYVLLAEYDTANSYFLNYAGNLPGNNETVSGDMINEINVAPGEALFISWRPTCTVGTYSNIGGVDDLNANFHFGPSDTSTTGIGTVQTQAFEISTYPNPATDMLNVSVRHARSTVAWSIVNSTGRFVLSGTFPASRNSTEKVDISTLAPGIYMTRFTTADHQNIIAHFIKQ